MQRVRVALGRSIVVLVVAVVSMRGLASSHREAPLISGSARRQHDVYAFVSPAILTRSR